MRIVDLKSEYFALEELILQAENEIDEETGEFIDNDDLIKELSDELKENKAGLLNYLVDKRDEYKLLEQGLNDKIKHLQGKKKTAQNQQRRIVDTIDYVLEGEKFKSDEHTFSYSKTERIDILDDGDIPPEFIDFKPTIKKMDLKKAPLMRNMIMWNGW